MAAERSISWTATVQVGWRSKTIHYLPFTIYLLLSPARDVAAGEAAPRFGRTRRGGERDVLHAQLREDHLKELLLLGVEVAARLLVQRAEHVYALLGELQVDAAAARMIDHAERVRRERGEELDEHEEVFRAARGLLRRRDSPLVLSPSRRGGLAGLDARRLGDRGARVFGGHFFGGLLRRRRGGCLARRLFLVYVLARRAVGVEQ